MDKTKLNKHFILASSSKRRLELLSQIDVEPDLILLPNIEEKIFKSGIDPSLRPEEISPNQFIILSEKLI